MNSRSTSHGSIKDGQKCYVKGNILNCSGYRIQVI
jgi:hypothetical protein